MSLREDQRDLTRRRIVAAVLDLAAGGADGISVPQVARRSGVSLATIYRHFPTRDDLLAAAADEPVRAVFEAMGHGDPTGDPLHAFHRALWCELAGNVPLVRRQAATAAGRELRDARGRVARGRVAAYLQGRGVPPGTASFERLVTLVHAQIGSLAFLELHDRQGLAVDDAVDAARFAIEALVAAPLREDP